jgi:cell division protein FtsI (penicillin-binding protein 3)
MQLGSETRLRIVAVMALLSVAFLAPVAQMLRWQVIDRDQLLARAELEHRGQVRSAIPPQRGFIYDRDGSLLAGNRATYDIAASPNMMRDEDHRRHVAQEIAAALGVTSDEILTKLDDVSRRNVYLAFQVPQSVADAIEAINDPALTTDMHPVRVYPHGVLASHLLGFVNSDKAGYTGVYGVEAFYDAVLRGRDGIGVAERDPYGSAIPVAFAQYTPPTDGRNLLLSIKYAAQYVVERELERALSEYGAESGTVVVLQPSTGAILAMASRPSYDPNRYADEASSDIAVFRDPAISKVYEPGSVVKVVTVAAAIDSGVITQDTILNDQGAIEVGGQPIHNWNNQAYGPVDITTVLGESLNVEAAQIAVMLGRERFYDYVWRFGFGRHTGVDLDGEEPGKFNTPDDPEWSESDLGRHSFGQAIDATPLQVATAIGAVANGGLMMRPYVVQAMSNGSEDVQTAAKPVRRVVTAQTAHTVTRMLETVVEQHTALARVPGYRVAGKSGTSQVYVPGGYHPTDTIASFVGYLPADRPAMLILVVIDRPDVSPWGGQVAAPVFARIAAQLGVLFGVPPDDVRQQAVTQPAAWAGQ